MVNYPPYVFAYGKLVTLFEKIREAAVPPKFTHDFLYTKLGLKSTTYRPMIPFIKKLGFIDDANIPTRRYRNYREQKRSKIVMAEAVRMAYKDLFSASEYAYKLKKNEILEKLKALLGTPADDTIVPKVASTFLVLCSLADFEKTEQETKILLSEPARKVMSVTSELQEPPRSVLSEFQEPLRKLGISYTINLNLPATNDIEVFNAIFKALKENLLK